MTLTDPRTTPARPDLAADFLSGTVAATRYVKARERRIIAASGGTVAVRAVRQALGVSARQLERKFEELVGVPPRFACKVARFQQSVDLALRRPDLPLGRLAAEAGYYDQPHFTREFKALAGITPAGFLAERRAVAFVQDDAGRVA